MFPQTESNPVGLSATATIPELQQSKTAVLNTLASKHSRRSYEYAIERFIAWYCSEPRLTFNGVKLYTVRCRGTRNVIIRG